MISMGRPPARADVDARAVRRAAEDVAPDAKRETPWRLEAPRAVTFGTKQAHVPAIVPAQRVVSCHVESWWTEVPSRASHEGAISDILFVCSVSALGVQTMLRAPTTALAPAGGVTAGHARPRGAARGKTAVARGAFYGASEPLDASRRSGNSKTFTMFASCSRARARGREAVRITASASASMPAPGSDTDQTQDDAHVTSPRLYPHLELDFTPRLTIPGLVSCVVSSWAVVIAYATLFSKFHLRHYTLSLKALSLEIASFAVVGAAAFWVCRTLMSEAQEQKRLVSAEKAADADSRFARVHGIKVHYKRRDGLGSGFGNSRRDERMLVISCVHGFGANAYSWERAVLGELAERLEASVVAHDAPGFGLTERSEDLSKYTPRANAAIARAMLDLAENGDADATAKERTGKTWNDAVDETETEGRAESGNSGDVASAASDGRKARRIIVGHSMGGISAAIAAAQGNIDDVVLIAPAVIAMVGVSAPGASASDASSGVNSSEASEGSKKKNPITALLGSVVRILRVLVAFLASPVLKFALRKLVRSVAFWREGLSKAVGAAAAQRLRVDASWADGYRRPSVVTGWDAGMVRVVLAAATGGVSLGKALFGYTSPFAEADKPENVIKALRDSKARVLIVHGSDDGIVPVGNSRRLKELIPRAEILVMPGVGHMPHEEAPEAFLEAVQTFLLENAEEARARAA